jgi:hypothetical protein
VVKTRRLAVLLGIVFADVVFGQQAPPAGLEKILVPITAKAVPGAYGTLWSSELWLTIGPARLPGFIAPFFGGCEPPCPDAGGGPSPGTFQIGFLHTPAGDPPGELLYVQRDVADQFHFTSMLREGTFEANGDSGLQIPVVRERDFVSGTIHITNIPIATSGRAKLRVYSIDPELGGAVRVRFFYASPDDTLYSDQTRTLVVHQQHYTYHAETGDFDFPVRPAVVEMPVPAPPAPGIAGYGSSGIRVEITPLTPGLRLWVFVSGVDNATQRVTLRTSG